MKFLKAFNLFESETTNLSGISKLEFDTVLKPGDQIGLFNPYHNGVSMLSPEDPFWVFLGWRYPGNNANGLQLWIASEKLKQIRILIKYELQEDDVRFIKGNFKIKSDLSSFNIKGGNVNNLAELIKKEGSFYSINREVDSKAFLTELNIKLEKASSRYLYNIIKIDNEFFLTKEASYKRATPKWDELLRLDVASLIKDEFEVLKDKLYLFDEYNVSSFTPDKFPRELNYHQQHELKGERDYSVSIGWKLKKK